MAKSFLPDRAYEEGWVARRADGKPVLTEKFYTELNSTVQGAYAFDKGRLVQLPGGMGSYYFNALTRMGLPPAAAGDFSKHFNGSGEEALRDTPATRGAIEKALGGRGGAQAFHAKLETGYKAYIKAMPKTDAQESPLPDLTVPAKLSDVTAASPLASGGVKADRDRPREIKAENTAKDVREVRATDRDSSTPQVRATEVADAGEKPDAGKAAPPVPSAPATARWGVIDPRMTAKKDEALKPAAAPSVPLGGQTKPDVPRSATPARVAKADPVPPAKAMHKADAITQAVRTIQGMYPGSDPKTVETHVRRELRDYLNLLAPKGRKLQGAALQAEIGRLSATQMAMIGTFGSGRMAALHMLAISPAKTKDGRPVKDMPVDEAMRRIYGKDRGMMDPHTQSVRDGLHQVSTRTGHGKNWLPKMVAHTDSVVGPRLRKHGIIVSTKMTPSQIQETFEKRVIAANAPPPTPATKKAAADVVMPKGSPAAHA